VKPEFIYIAVGSGPYRINACLIVVPGNTYSGWIFFAVDSNAGPIPISMKPLYWTDDDPGSTRKERIVEAKQQLENLFTE